MGGDFGWGVGEYYFSLQAEGGDPARDRIITLQYQPLGEGGPQGHLTILAEWEWGEKEAIRSILEKGLLDPSSGFIPVGFDLRRKLGFLVERARRHGFLKGIPEPVEAHVMPRRMVDLAEGPGGPPAEVEHLRAMDVEVATLYHRQRFQGILEHLERERRMVLEVYGRARNSPREGGPAGGGGRGTKGRCNPGR